jgi:hypothetical protein
MSVASGAAYNLPVPMTVDVEARVAYAIDSKLDAGTRWLRRRELAKLSLQADVSVVASMLKISTG